MKQRVIILLIVLLLPFAVLNASTPLTEFPKEKNVKVSVDYTKVQDALALSFSNSPVGDTHLPSDYDAVSGVGPTIVIAPQNGELVARSSNDLYLNWKIYTDQILDISLRLDGPLSYSGGKPINWMVSLKQAQDGTFLSTPDGEGTVVSIGSDKHETFDYSNVSQSKVLIHSTDSTSTGYSGSAYFSIVTESLIGFEVNQTYEAYLTAEITTRT